MTEVPTNELIPQDQIEIFLKTVNERGFILEEQVHEVLQNVRIDSIEKNPLYTTIDGGQIEADAVVSIGGCHFIIECKRTNYKWAFMKAKDSSDYILFIRKKDGDYYIKDLGFNKPTSSHGFGVMAADSKLEIDKGFVRTAYKDVREAAKQVLAETEAYIKTRQAEAIYIPTVVTNAQIFQLDYEKSKIDSEGNLGGIHGQKEISEIYYNIPQVIRRESSTSFEKKPIVPKGGALERHHVKSVLFLNIHYLKNLPQIARNIFNAFPS